ncbi:hypothetical protein [Enterococcus ureasiticus]|uniref:Uncharacterized protein n=1 Tax=Enterococcus ureasiticus TaxID=903984 RepID=A0A1E5GHM5_9ENTE|nr:hypothetical protein [Enterococcus ureasiticus]OEG12179.1 hypothetical protein BCR21_08050 [Enterococcus ureasiticus]
MDIEIPTILHEVFGKRQRVTQLIGILSFGIILTTLLFMYYPSVYLQISLWRRIAAFVFVVDIFSGCIANFTKSTNNYYANDKLKQIIFLSIHFHLILVAIFLGISIWSFLLVWLYTIVCSFIIIFLRKDDQIFVGGFLLCVGLAAIVMLEMEGFMMIVSMLFLIKVLFSFSVDHYQK